MQRVKKIIHNATSTPKRRWTSLIVLLVVGGLVTGGIFYWNAHKKSIIKNEIDQTLNRRTGGLYELRYNKFELDEVGGSLLVTDLKLNYDSTVYSNLTDQEKIPSVLVNISIPKLDITGVQTPRALLEKELVGENVVLTNPVIEIVYTEKGKDSARNLPREEVYRALLGNLKLLRVANIELNNATVFTRRINRKDTGLKVENLSVKLTDALIDSLSGSDTSRLWYSKKINFTADKVKWYDKQRLYVYRIDSIELNSYEHLINVERMQMDATMGEEEFMKHVGVQADRFDNSFRNIRFRQVDFRKLLDEGVGADSLIIGSANVKVYKDHNQPRDKKNRVGNYPHQALMKLNIPVNIRTAVVKDAYIEYKQNTPKTGKKGKVQFYNTNAVIYNITNEKEAIRKNGVCRADTRTMFMNKAPLKASFFFNLNSKNGGFEIKATLGEFDARLITEVSQPLASAKVEEGIIHSADIYIKGSDYVGDATITLLYEDLKIAVMEKDEESGKMDKKGLISMAANIIIKNNNPGSDGKPRIGKGRFQRDTNRAFFNLVWKSLYVAIADTMGAPTKNKAEEEKKAEDKKKNDDKRGEKEKDNDKKNEEKKKNKD